jgi:hypothetical protein
VVSDHLDRVLSLENFVEDPDIGTDCHMNLLSFEAQICRPNAHAGKVLTLSLAEDLSDVVSMVSGSSFAVRNSRGCY